MNSKLKNKKNLLRRIINETARGMLAQGRCTVEDVANEVVEGHGDLVAAEAQNLIYEQVKEVVRSLLRDFSDDDGDADPDLLPGLKLPSVIAVKRTDGGYDYVRTDKANWDDLQAGLQEREENIVRATIKRDQYRTELDRLAPWMQRDKAVTVADALRMERKA